MGCGSSSKPQTVHSLRSGQNYDKHKQLGVGASCEVWSVTCKETQKKYAMKQLSASNSNSQELWEMEVKLLKLLGDNPHQNVLHFEDAFSDEKSFYILTKLCEGGELFDRVCDGRFTERKARDYAKMMLESVAHCHSMNLCHRDLKPENYVFDGKEENANMRLIDFGVAKVLKDDEKNSDALGSPYYVAPEVLDKYFPRNGKSWKASDMWSLGVIIFMFVVGYPPFNSTDDDLDSIYSAITTQVHHWPTKMKKKGQLSPEVMDLVDKLLNKDPYKRPTAAEALAHPWMKTDAVSDTPVDKQVVEALSGFRKSCMLKKAVAKVMANKMTPDDVKKVEELFKKFDVNGDGRLGKDEIAAMMAHIGQGSKAAKALVDMADDDGDGVVDLDEFKAVQQQTAVDGQTSQELKKTFDLFDTSGDGFISKEELSKMLKLSTEEAEAIINDSDASGDGKIDFDEWVKAMQARA